MSSWRVVCRAWRAKQPGCIPQAPHHQQLHRGAPPAGACLHHAAPAPHLCPAGQSWGGAPAPGPGPGSCPEPRQHLQPHAGPGHSRWALARVSLASCKHCAQVNESEDLLEPGLATPCKQQQNCPTSSRRAETSHALQRPHLPGAAHISQSAAAAIVTHLPAAALPVAACSQPHTRAFHKDNLYVSGIVKPDAAEHKNERS